MNRIDANIVLRYLLDDHAVFSAKAIDIIETFAKIRELARNIKVLSNEKDKAQQEGLMQKSGEIIAEILDDYLLTTDTETTVEINFAVLKFKHLVKKKEKQE